MPRSLDKERVIRLDSRVRLEPFEKKLWNGDHWGIVRARRGKSGEIDWVETFLGVRGKQAHAHMGTNIDGTRRFLEPRGVLKGLVEYAENAHTGEQIDKVSTTLQGGAEYEFRWGLSTNKETNSARIVNLKLVRVGELSTNKD